MLEFIQQGRISLKIIVEKMCHNPAIPFTVMRKEKGDYPKRLILPNLTFSGLEYSHGKQWLKIIYCTSVGWSLAGKAI